MSKAVRLSGQGDSAFRVRATFAAAQRSFWNGWNTLVWIAALGALRVVLAGGARLLGLPMSHVYAAIAGGGFWQVVMSLGNLRSHSRLVAAEVRHGAEAGPFLVTLDPGGYHVENEAGRCSLPWAWIDEVVTLRDGIALRSGMAFVPIADVSLPAPVSKQELIDCIDGWRADAAR